MFTGIIKNIGKVTGIGANHLIIEAPQEDFSQGESISVNGICLTLVSLKQRRKGVSALYFDASHFTRTHTTLNTWRVNQKVNLERATLAGEPLGGHILSGHIDGVGRIHSIGVKENAHIITIVAQQSLVENLIPKGSVAIDGISLTVLDVCKSGEFTLSIIPYTFNHTNLRHSKVGDSVNIELDIVGKYVRHTIETLMPRFNDYKKIDVNFLKEKGFI